MVTRFAPSPTGYLHVGGARTALFNWLAAKHYGGKFLLRIEDTDLARSTEDATRQLLSDLQWLGLQWDNPELVYQSKRLSIYNRIIEELLNKRLAYQAWETTGELDSMREQAARAKRPFIYRKISYTADQLKRFADEGRKSVVRFAMPVREYRFADVVLGKDVVQPAMESQDFVIRKTDGMPTYHFGVVVDDAEMGITHVLRGLEHLKNTFSHIALQEALGYPRPIYAHLSVMLNPETGEKLSKRDRDRRIRKRAGEWMRNNKKSFEDLEAGSGFADKQLQSWFANDPPQQLGLDEQLRVMRVIGLRESDLPEIMVCDFRKNGYVPEVLLNFLALQGWSPGGDLEQMSVGDMVEKFTLDRINSANPKFNREKLISFSTDLFAKASRERLIAAMRDFLSVHPDSPVNRATDEQLGAVLEMNGGFRVLHEVEEKSRFFFVPSEQIEYQADAVEKVLAKNERQGFNALAAVRPILASVEPWKAEAIEAAVKGYCEKSGLGLGKVAQPIRVAVSGTTISPPIFQSLELLGREQTLARVDRASTL